MTLPRPIAAVIFDMDGLLFDTEPLYYKAMCRAASEKQFILPRTLYLDMVGLPWESTYAQLRSHYGSAFAAEDFCERVKRHYSGLLSGEVRLKSGVIELLDLLDDRRLPRAIATSSERAMVDHHLAAHDLSRRFDVVVAAGDYTDGKPHPAPYLSAATMLGIDAACCLALEDSHNGVRSASAAGMMTIMVPDLLPPTEEMRRLCTLVAQDLHEVRQIMA